jgi:hypothetical protein
LFDAFMAQLGHPTDQVVIANALTAVELKARAEP